MCRRSSVLIIAIVALWLSPAVIGDDVAAYLERHGLQQLLAVHLEQLLEDQNGAARNDLVLRLAGLYAQLLESTDDPALRCCAARTGPRSESPKITAFASPIRCRLTEPRRRWPS